MNITRDNYETFLMLLADNELTAIQRTAVEAFIAANPDLQHELDLFLAFKLTPDETVRFENKAALLKQQDIPDLVTPANCEAFFVLYADQELTAAESIAVENFVSANPLFSETFAQLQSARLAPEPNIVFRNKEILFRKKDDTVIPFGWWKMAIAAAMVLFVMGLGWLNRENKQAPPLIAVTGPALKPVVKKLAGTAATQREENQIKETVAATTAVTKRSVPVNRPSIPVVTSVAVKEKISTSGNFPVMQDVVREEPATINMRNQSSSNVAVVIDRPKNIEIKKPLIAAVKELVPDQPSVILNPDENDQTKPTWTSYNPNNNVEIMATSVNTKNPLRGIFRKASRLIGKRTGPGNEDNNRKSILIGGFEIAVR